MTKADGFSTHHAALAGVIFAAMLVPPTQAADWSAGGNEPSWRVEMSDKAIVFSTLDSESITVEPVPEPVLAEGVEVYSAMAGGETFTLVATERICTDPMSGMPFPKTVVAALGGQPFVGCGGDPLGLLVGEWRIELIGGKPVISGSETTLAFDVDGSMHGNAACNRFFGGYALTGESLTLSPAGATRMACENELMDQEDRFLSALEQVVRFGRTATGQLQLFGADGSVVLTASP